jgi:hypothetical protein
MTYYTVNYHNSVTVLASFLPLHLTFGSHTGGGGEVDSNGIGTWVVTILTDNVRQFALGILELLPNAVTNDEFSDH